MIFTLSDCIFSKSARVPYPEKSVKRQAALQGGLEQQAQNLIKQAEDLNNLAKDINNQMKDLNYRTNDLNYIGKDLTQSTKASAEAR